MTFPSPPLGPLPGQIDQKITEEERAIHQHLAAGRQVITDYFEEGSQKIADQKRKMNRKIEEDDHLLRKTSEIKAEQLKEDRERFNFALTQRVVEEKKVFDQRRKEHQNSIAQRKMVVDHREEEHQHLMNQRRLPLQTRKEASSPLNDSNNLIRDQKKIRPFSSDSGASYQNSLTSSSLTREEPSNNSTQASSRGIPRINKIPPIPKNSANNQNPERQLFDPSSTNQPGQDTTCRIS